jgi:Na+/H+ antiporter NhaD/arsenite permease-like protein
LHAFRRRHTPEREAADRMNEHMIGQQLQLFWVIPFGGILLSIALFPLIAPKFWHSHFPKISAFWALVFAIPFVILYRGVAGFNILEIFILDYFPFIILLWGLFTVSGGIHVKGTLKGTPQLNIIFLLIGTALASWIGTTGASMLLIRPVLRANAKRRHKVHIIIFFIFLVSNIGGSLTPLGDPPLFLGFLHSVPFFWTFSLIVEMGFLAIVLLSLFFLLDTYYYRKEEIEEFEPVPLSIDGLHNIIFLLGIIGAVLLSGLWHPGHIDVLGVRVQMESLARDFLILLMGVLSLKTTRAVVYRENEFTWFPIKEVAILFAGIFMTIIPALAILKAGEHGALAPLMSSLKDPSHFFWATGALSSFLDNAPTYLTFFNTALGEFSPGLPEPQAVAMLIAKNGLYLKAIACGAVFMGANTYIGNAPNFMVRSIAEEAGIRMPSFFGYMLKYSIPILIPSFILTTIIFFF